MNLSFFLNHIILLTLNLIFYYFFI